MRLIEETDLVAGLKDKRGFIDKDRPGSFRAQKAVEY